MHSIRIDDELYDKISLYCKENNLKINVFCNDILKKKLFDEMYGDAPFMAEAVMIKSDTPNSSGRVIPKEVLEKAVEEFKENVKEPKDKKIGELTHPVNEAKWEELGVTKEMQDEIKDNIRNMTKSPYEPLVKKPSKRRL